MNEQIERYLMDQMTADERLAFEQTLSTDPALKAEMELQQTLLLGIETEALKAHMADIFAEESAPQKATIKELKPRKSTNWWAIAAGMLILIAAGGYFFIQPLGSSNFHKLYFPDPGLPTPMSATDNYDFFDAMVDYKSGKYQIAIQKWVPMQEVNTTNDTLTYYLASAHLANKNYERANDYFETLLDEEGPYREKARWYWSLSAAQLNNEKLVLEKWEEWNFDTNKNIEFPVDALKNALNK